MQSTGHTSTQLASLVPMHGSVITYGMSLSGTGVSWVVRERLECQDDNEPLPEPQYRFSGQVLVEPGERRVGRGAQLGGGSRERVRRPEGVSRPLHHQELGVLPGRVEEHLR